MCLPDCAHCLAAGDFGTSATSFNASMFFVAGPANQQFIALHLLPGWDAAVMWLSGIRATKAGTPGVAKGLHARTPHPPCGESQRTNPEVAQGGLQCLHVSGAGCWWQVDQGTRILPTHVPSVCAQQCSWLAAVPGCGIGTNDDEFCRICESRPAFVTVPGAQPTTCMSSTYPAAAATAEEARGGTTTTFAGR